MLTGIDASIEISLGEYGFAWKEVGGDYHIYYGIACDDNGDYTRFDWADIPKNTGVRKEFDWITENDWQYFLGFTGFTEEEFLEQPLPYKIWDLYRYFGYLNIFGESYTEGVTIDILTA